MGTQEWLVKRLSVNKSFDSFIKHLKGSMMSQLYYAQVSPGLENLLSRELKDLGARKRQITQGGVSFEGTRKHFYRILQQTRIASRIWETLCQCSVPNPNALYQKSSKIEWMRYLTSEDLLSIKAVLHHSHLAGSGQVESIVWNSIRTAFKSQARQPPILGNWGSLETNQRILIYIEGGTCQIRIDGSGEHLHRRGWRLQDGPAPLRPTLAYACLSALDWSVDEPLIDIMCGSGTFSIEAINRVLNRSPRLPRPYACTRWPNFDANLWDQIQNPAPLRLVDPSSTHFHWMSDISNPSLLIAQEHLAHLQLEKYGHIRCQIHQHNALELTWNELSAVWDQAPTPRSGLLIVNPPYGKRVSDHTKRTRIAQQLCQRLPQLIENGGQGWRAGVLMPSAIALQAPIGWHKQAIISFSHGGIPVTLWKFQLK